METAVRPRLGGTALLRIFLQNIKSELGHQNLKHPHAQNLREHFACNKSIRSSNSKPQKNLLPTQKSNCK